MTSQSLGETHFTQNPRERQCWAQPPEGQRPSIAPLETIVVSTISGLVSHATHLEQMRNWFNVQRPYLAIFIFSALSKCYLINLLDSIPFNSCTCFMFINSYKLFNALIVHFQFLFFFPLCSSKAKLAQSSAVVVLCSPHSKCPHRGRWLSKKVR